MSENPFSPAADANVQLPSEPQVPALRHRSSMVASLDAPVQDWRGNLDLSTWTGKALLVKAGSPSDMEFDDSGECRISATHWLIYPEEGVSRETGEVTLFARTVLFTADGRTFKTTSEFAPSRMRVAMELFSPEEWASGLPFVVRERKSRKTGRVYHDLTLDMTPPADAKERRKGKAKSD
jgi:hypothetical protein